MVVYYNIVIVLFFLYIFYKNIVIFSPSSLRSSLRLYRQDNLSFFGFQTKKYSIKIWNDLCKVVSLKVLLLCTGLAVSGSFLFMQEQLFLLSLLPEDGFEMVYYSTFWFSHMDIFPGINSYLPDKYPKLTDHSMYIYYQKSINKFYSFILIGVFFFCSVLHCLAGLISLLYDYFLKRIFLKNNYILTFVLLLLVQSFLKIFFLFSFLCLF